MAACGAKNFHKVNFDLSAVWLDFAGVFGRWISAFQHGDLRCGSRASYYPALMPAVSSL